MRRKRRNHSATFKAKVALDALKGGKTIAETADIYDLHANQVQQWRRQLLDNATEIYGSKSKLTQNSKKDIHDLQAKVGQLTMERDFFSTCARSLSRKERKMKIDKSDRLPIVHQCKLLDISRSTAYYKPLTREIDPDLSVMKEIDKLHLQFPFMGSRRLKNELRDLGFYRINRKKVQRLMLKMGIRATRTAAK
jgi:transposase-like protein